MPAKRRDNGAGAVRYNKERDRWECRLTVHADGKTKRQMVTAKTKTLLQERM